jgi:hypothetical protein
MKPVVSQFLDGPGGNNEYSGQSQGKTDKTEYDMTFKPGNISEGNNKLIPD